MPQGDKKTVKVIGSDEFGVFGLDGNRKIYVEDGQIGNKYRTKLTHDSGAFASGEIVQEL